MDKEKLENIKLLTKYSLSEIKTMSDIEFWHKITKLMVSGKLSPEQHNWLDKQRTGKGLDSLTLDLLDKFGGRVIK